MTIQSKRGKNTHHKELPHISLSPMDMDIVEKHIRRGENLEPTHQIVGYHKRRNRSKWQTILGYVYIMPAIVE